MDRRLIHGAGDHVKLIAQRMDFAVAGQSDLELGNGFRLVVHGDQLLGLGQNRLHRPSCHLRNMRDMAPERQSAANAEAAEAAAVVLVDVSDLVFRNAQPIGQKLPRRINVLPVSPEGELVALPRGDAAEGLHRDDPAAAVVIGELPHNSRLGETLLHIAVAPYRSRMRVDSWDDSAEPEADFLFPPAGQVRLRTSRPRAWQRTARSCIRPRSRPPRLPPGPPLSAATIATMSPCIMNS